MPVQTGIQIRLRMKFKNSLDSGCRRNDEKSQVSIEIQKPRLGADGRLIAIVLPFEHTVEATLTSRIIVANICVLNRLRRLVVTLSLPTAAP